MKYHVVAVAAAALLCSPATAATLVDTGTPTGQGGSNGWILASNQTLAGLFTLAAATTVTSVEGFIRNFSGVAANGTISIFTGGVDPANSALQYSAGFTIAETGISAGAWQGVFGQSWALAAGQHWVVFTSDGQLNTMTYLPPNPLAQHANAPQLSGPWTQRGSAFGLGVRITNDAAPIIVTPPVPGAVPEPATWAMLLLGFGAIGGAMRSQRRMAVSFG